MSWNLSRPRLSRARGPQDAQRDPQHRLAGLGRPCDIEGDQARTGSATLYMLPVLNHYQRMRVAGVAVEGGKVYLAAACRADDATIPLLAPVEKGSRRIEPNKGLDEAHRLVDLTHRIEQQLRALSVSRVGLVGTRKYAGLKYADASARITCVCAVMAACVQCDVDFCEIKTSTIGKHIGVDPKLLGHADHARFGFADAPAYWKLGIAKAYAAASVLLGQ